MASLAHTIRRPARLRSHLGAYAAGVGATGALTAGAVVVFLSMATFVAFKGLPFGGLSDGTGAAYLSSSTGSPPGAAAAALEAARGAVAKAPVPAAYRTGGFLRPGSGGSAHVRSSRGGGSSGSGARGGGAAGPGGGSVDPGAPGATSPGATPSAPVPSIPSDPPSAPSVPTTPSVPSLPDPPDGVNPPPVNVPSLPNTPSVPSAPDLPSVGGVVDRVDDAAGTNLSGATGGVTRVLDGIR